MNYPFVSVMVITYNVKNTIEVCLNSLTNLDYPSDKYEIIVVDGCSKDGTVDIIRRYAVKLIIEPRKGRSIARNTGIKFAKGEIIAFTDADCEVNSEWLKFHVQAHSSENGVMAVGGAIVPSDEKSELIAAIHYTNFGEYTDCSPRRLIREIPTCNISFKRGILKDIGLFDERLDAYEDSLICWRIIRAGKKILFDPRIRVKHSYSPSNQDLLSSFLEKEKLNGQSHYLLQIIDKTFPYRLPENVFLVAVAMPIIASARACRRLFTLLKYSRKKLPPIAIIYYITLGAVWWGFGYTSSVLKAWIKNKFRMHSSNTA